MSHGSIEVVMIVFGENRFTGEIVPELQRLTEAGTISVLDGLFVTKDEDGNVTFVELEEEGLEGEIAQFAALLDEVESVISDEDVVELTNDMPPNSSAAVLVYEHTWAKELRGAIQRAGGTLAAQFRVPDQVFDEVIAALAEPA